MFVRTMARALCTLAALALLPCVATAQTPVASSGVPTESFLGEQFCFVTNLSNTGAPGYGPYLRLELPPSLSFDSAEIFDSAMTVVQNSVFPGTPPAPSTLNDPLIRAPTSPVVNGTAGNRLIILQLPVGSITQGGPPLESEICLTIQPTAVVGTPIPVRITPVYQFGDTPTGANGSIIGATPTQSVTPTVILFEKTNTAPEFERPPGAVWPYEYVLSVDIANTAVINPLVISDTLPADVQFVGPITTTGGVNCTPTSTPSTVTPGGTVSVTCSGATTGTTADADVVVRFPVHIVDTLDEGTCGTETLTNSGLVTSTYVPASPAAPVPLGALADTSDVEAKHVALQKSVSPATGDPGTAVTYTLQFQTTQFGTTSALSMVDTLPDGIDFVAHGSLTVNGAPVAIAPTVVPGVNDSITYDIRAANGANFAPGTAITLTFTAQVQQLFAATGDAVLAADVLSNTATATYSLVEGATACTDGTAADFVVDPVDIVKRVLTVGPYEPGDTVRFRLSMNIPSGDTQNVVFRDFFPLPVFDVGTLNLNYGGPDIFRAVGGPGADTMNLVPTSIVIDAATNALIITFPNVNTPSAQTVAVDIEIDVLPEAFADNLFLTNIFRASSANTGLIETNENAPVQIQVFSPALRLTKGVLSTTPAGAPAVIAPLPTVLPVNGNVTGVDAGDQIAFRVTLENIGRAPAYDVVVTDLPVTNLNACTVVNTQLASGGALTTSGTLATGLTLLNGAPGNPVLAANDGTLGAPFAADTAFVDITCTLAAAVAPGNVLTNVASATWKPQPLGTPGVETFPPVSDNATATVRAAGIAKSLVATSEGSTTAANVAIGEIARYRLAVRVPEGTINNFVIRDLLPTGMQFVNDGTVTAGYVADTAGSITTAVALPTTLGSVVPASPTLVPFVGTISTGNDPGTTCAGAAPTTSGADPCFQFGNLTNTENDANDEWVVLEFNALVLNVQASQAGTVLANGARAGSGATQLAATSANTNVTVVEPGVGLTKSVLPTTADAGDVLTYTLTLTNPTGATAFETRLVDVVDPRLAVNIASVTVTPNAGALGITNNSAGQTIDIDVATLQVGGSVVVTFQVAVDNVVQPGNVIPNVATFSYSGLPGANGTPIGGPGNATGSANTGAPGSGTGERNGSGAPLNDYLGSANANVTITSVSLAKSVVATSLGYTADGRVRGGIADLAIGETATFRITATIPEGTTPQVVITDVVPSSNGVMEVLSGTVISVSPLLSPANPNPPGVIANEQLLPDTINDTIRFDFGQVLNPAPNGPGQIVVEVTARLVNVPANQNTDQLTNTATVAFGPGLNGSASAGVDVVEPLLQIQKTSPTTTGQAGDVVNFSLAISHTGASNANAQAVVIQDVLPTPMGLDTLVFGSIVPSGTCVPAPVFDTSGNSATQLLIEVDQLPLGCSLAVTYSATLQNDVQVGTSVVNTADLTWHSIDPTAPDGGFGRAYGTDDDHAVLISSPGVLKSVTATSAPSTGTGQINPALPDLTIGETVTYQFSVVLPSGQSPNAVAVDQLPTGNVSMQVVSSRIVSVGSGVSGAPTPVVGAAGVASDTADIDALTDRVTWTLGTLSANPAASATDRTLVFEVVARVMSTPQTSGGVTVRNTAEFTTSTAGTISGTADVDIVEPRLTLAKAITSPVAPVIVQAGDTIAFQVTLTHATGLPGARSDADAFNVVVSDTLPNPGVSFNAGSVGGTCAGVTANASAYPLVTFSFASLPLASASCTITYTGTVTNTVTPSTTYANLASAEFDSLPVPVAGQTRHGTTNTGIDDFTILGPSLVKVSTSSDLSQTGIDEADPALFDLAIGETVVYTLTVGFPEGTTINAVLTDALPTGADGVLEVIGTTFGGFGNAGISTSNPFAPVFADSDGDGRNDFTTIDFGTITNLPNGSDTDDFLTVQLVARVADVPENADGIVLTNDAEFTTGTTTPVADDASVDVVEPSFAITKTMGPVVGGVVTIQVVLQNTGNAPAYDIEVEDILNSSLWQPGSVTPASIPAGFVLATAPGPGPGDTRVTISSDPLATLPAGSIAAGGQLVASFTAQLVSVPPPVNPVVNVATNTGAASHPDDINPDQREYDDIDDEAQLGPADVQVRKTVTSVVDADGNGVTSPGDTVVFTIVVDNSAGSGPLTGIAIDDLVPPNTTFDTANSTAGWTGCADNAPAGTACSILVANIAAGGSGSVAFAVTIDNPLPANVVTIVNQALVTASELPDPIPSDDPGPPGDEDPTETPVEANPILSIVKTDDVADGLDVAPGATIRYTLAFENIGNQTATGVVLRETVPANTTYNAAASAPNAWSCVPNNAAGAICILPIGSLPVNVPGSALFAVDVIDPVPAGVTSIANTAIIVDDRDNSDDDDETTPLDGTPGLNIAKSDGGISTVPGGTVGYTLRYWNDGDQDAAGVVITETVPLFTTFLPGASTAGWVCAPNNSAGSTCTLSVGTLVGQTPAANADTATFSVIVDATLPTGIDTLFNTAVIEDNSGGTDTSSDDTPVAAAPDLTLTKDDGGSTAGPGDGIAWTLSYANVGNQAATNVLITDTVPANTTFDAGASTAGWTCAPNGNAGSLCSLAVGTLAAGANGSATFAVTVDAPLPAGIEQVLNNATIGDDGDNGIDPTPGDNTDGDDTPLEALPVLTVLKDDGGITTTAGGSVVYTLTYANTGDQDASNVTLTDTVPLHTTFNAASSEAGWSCADGAPSGTVCTINVGTVAAGAAPASVAFGLDVDLTLPTDVTQVENTVFIASDGSGGEGTDPQDDDSDETPIDAAPDLTISKSDGGTSNVPGGTIVYTLSVENVGTQDATGVTITETVPANTSFAPAGSTAGWACAPDGNAGATCSFDIGALAAGAPPVDVNFAVLVDALLPDGITEVLNTATVADDGDNGIDPTPGNNTSSDDTPIAAGPDLTLLKTDGGVTGDAGGVVVYTLTYDNVGTQDATGVTITETVPANTTFDLAGSTAGWSCADGAAAGSVCTFAVGNVAAADVAQNLAFAVQIDDPLPAGVEQVANTAVIADDGSNGDDPTPENNTGSDDTPLAALPDLAIVKTDNDAIATAGGTVAYTLTWTNNGNQDASGVVIEETVPANTRFSAAGSTAGWTCADQSPAGSACSFVVGNVAAGEGGSTVFAVQVLSPLDAGIEQVANTVTIDDDGSGGIDPTPEDNTDSDDTPVTAAPDLVIVKDAVQDVGAAGGTLVYTLTYSNVGTQHATGVVITETVPANTTFLVVGSSAGWSCADGAAAGTTCTLAVGNVDAGAPAQSVTFAVLVDEPLPANVAVIANTAVIADDGDNGIDPTPENNTDGDETPLSAAPDMRLLKTADVTQVEPGDVITYTLTYSNTGVRDATGVVITETVPAGTVYVAAGSTAGWTCADGSAAGTTCELAVGDVDAGDAPATALFVVRVLDDAEEGVANAASIADDGSSGPDPTPDNNVDDVAVPIDGLPEPVESPNVIPAMDDVARWLLLLAMLSIGLLAVRSRR